MIKKEINEIKSLFKSVDEANIQRLCGCYVDGEKKIVSSFNSSFLSIDKTEKHKYLEIFQKSLSGTQGKNLLDMSFLLGTDGNRLLESMRKSELKEEKLNSLFFEKIIETYEFVGPYLILLIYQAYDVPQVTEDGIKNDESSEVYSYIMCSLCPIAVTKADLGYFEDSNEFHPLKQEKYVKMPENAFLYPAFNDRSSDTGSILYYTQKGDRAETRMLSEFLGVKAQLAPQEQKETFQSLVKETVADIEDIDIITAVHENLAEMVTEKKKMSKPGTPVMIDKDDVKIALKKSGVQEEKVQNFENRFEEEFPAENNEKQLYAANIVPTNSKLEMKTPDVVVKINYDKTSLVETRIIDGKRCLVIELGEGLVVNGIPVKHLDDAVLPEINEAESDAVKKMH